MPKMHAALETFFATHKATTCDHKRACHNSLTPIMAVADAAVAHVNALQSQLTAAELAEHDHALDGKFEWMHVRLRAAAERAAAFRSAGRDLAKVMVEVERSFEQDEIDIGVMLANPGARVVVAPLASVPDVKEVVSLGVN